MSEEYEPGLASVVVPTYNRASLLPETMGSVWAQTYRPIELLIVDDGSSDSTQQLVADWADAHSSDPHFTLRSFRQRNRGAPAALNLGLIESRGEFIRHLGSDDTIEQNATSLQVDAIVESRCGVVYGDWWDDYVDSSGKVARSVARSGGDLADPVTALLERHWSAAFCYLFTRKSIVDGGAWDERLEGNQDFGFAMRVAMRGASFRHVPGGVGRYRHHTRGHVSTNDRYRWAKSTELVLVEVEDVLTARGELSVRRRYALARYYLTIAKEVYGRDRGLFRQYIAEMHRLAPGIRPPGVVYRLLVGAIGYERAEWLLEIRRRVRQRVRWRHQ